MPLGTDSDASQDAVRVPSVPAAVAGKLRAAILAGRLKSGERLIEQKLAARFGIGQPTLREALRELESQGFVRRSPKRGTYVTELTPEDYRKILEVRMALETLAIERAAPNVTREALADLGRYVNDLEAAAHIRDLARYHSSDMAFHQRIWELAENEFLSQALERVTFGLFAFVLLQPPTRNGAEFLEAVKQHKDILEGLRSGNPAVAREVFIRSTLKFWREQHHVKIGAAVGSPAEKINRGGPVPVG
jgi:DNA-binding GntR family transcriptional regulator